MGGGGKNLKIKKERMLLNKKKSSYKPQRKYKLIKKQSFDTTFNMCYWSEKKKKNGPYVNIYGKIVKYRAMPVSNL